MEIIQYNKMCSVGKINIFQFRLLDIHRQLFVNGMSKGRAGSSTIQYCYRIMKV